MSILFGIKIFDDSNSSLIIDSIKKMSCASLMHENEKLATYVSPCGTTSICGTKMVSANEDNVSFLQGYLFDDIENTEKKLETLNKHLSQNDSVDITLSQTNGAFSIIHYNKNKHLILAVDQFGIKSLYYAVFKQGIVFSSNLSVLFASSLIKPKFSSEIFLLNATVRMDAVSDLTWFDGVKQLDPGELLTIDPKNTINVKRYWLPPQDVKIIKEAELFESFMKATKIRSKSDNLGVLLSGGVDSAAVAAALIKKRYQRSESSTGLSNDRPIRTIVFCSKFFIYK
jgi:asparagine synthetase B (glutamine-hydrolysing)